jgi:hypothetical protein
MLINKGNSNKPVNVFDKNATVTLLTGEILLRQVAMILHLK